LQELHHRFAFMPSFMTLNTQRIGAFTSLENAKIAIVKLLAGDKCKRQNNIISLHE